ncbi:hypothetical protein BGZ96_011486 [Linnemannia gamsii]|uniref:Uncharacterized protein n=1 Tax=Linnemannia gamsii TaxID=64522 RepID=A0ABQ7KBX3_9FUNG|nr:hypothetical protein BGZ96_011486 [Linnemannia gamsii]
MSIRALGTFVGLTLFSPSKVVRNNGEKIKIQPFPTWTGEVIATLKLFLDWRMVVLIPMFLSSSWFYTYQFNSSQSWFSTRTQSLNNMLYWGAQIVGSYTFGRMLDYHSVNRRTRAIWKLNHGFNEGGIYIGPMFLYILYGLGVAAWQTYCYWLMGALSNDVTLIICFALLGASVPGAFFFSNRLENETEEVVHDEHIESKLDEKHEIQV